MNIVESTIPPDMTIEQWRRLRRGSARTQRSPWSLLLVVARRVARHRAQPCDHLHDTASRYDHAAKIHDLAYEPRFEPTLARSAMPIVRGSW